MNKVEKILRRVALFCGLLGMTIVSYSQSPSYPLNFGLYGGITASQVNGDSYTGFKRIGLNAGAFMNQHIVSDIYWQAELKYVTRGVYKGPEDYDPTLYRSSYHYVEIPLSAHYMHDEKFLVELGISPEVLLTTSYEDENGELNPSSYPENRTFGLSVFAGFGYWFSPGMGINLRYTNSAIPFRDPQEWNNAQYKGYFHNVISLSLTYRFKRNKQ
jgi:hypothetical protein